MNSLPSSALPFFIAFFCPPTCLLVTVYHRKVPENFQELKDMLNIQLQDILIFILTSNPPLNRTKSMDPLFFPIPLWDLKI
jgi:hypothetical protein